MYMGLSDRAIPRVVAIVSVRASAGIHLQLVNVLARFQLFPTG